MAATAVAVAATGVPITAAAASPSTSRSTGTDSSGCQDPRALPSLDRGYRHHVPDDATADKALPLILAFHGGGSSATEIEEYSGLDAADAVVVYPEGRTFHDASKNADEQGWAPNTNLPDVGPDLAFTRSLVTGFERSFCIDTSRVYATGKSEGGGFADALACQPPDSRLVDAIAPVAGAFYRADHAGVSDCSHASPLPVLEFHGAKDQVIRYGGTDRSQPVYTAFDARDRGWVDRWVDRDGCDRTQLGSSSEKGEVHFRDWGGCDANVRVQHYELLDGNHTWPGALSRSGPGAVDRQICATDTMLQFFGVTRLGPLSKACDLTTGSGSAAS